jgi:hypothetical protein
VLTIQYPVEDPASTGWGLQVRVHTDSALSGGEIITLQLETRPPRVPQQGIYARGLASVGLSSGFADVILGFDTHAGGPIALPRPWPGIPLGWVLDGYAELRTGVPGTLIEFAVFDGRFLHDPVTGLGRSLMENGWHDPMLDDILAAVRRTFPAT